MEFKIENINIGDDHPTFFIAEAGVNHNGSLQLAKELIDAASKAGADSIKFQTFKAGEISTKHAPKSTYHIETTGKDSNGSWYDLLKSQEISEEMHYELIDYCKKKKIIFLSTAYSKSSAEFLNRLGVSAFKVASTDTNNIPFISYLSKIDKPIILSTAMSTFDEVKKSVDNIQKYNNRLVVLQCTGNYPASLEDSNLMVLKTYKKAFNCLVGYSDHTLEYINPIAATALGSCVYEKHFTLDKNLDGPDHRMSLDPKELEKTIKIIRETEKSLGNKDKFVLVKEQENRVKLRKSLVAENDISAGMIITNDMIGIKRPGGGILPAEIDNIVGKKTKVFIPKDSLIKYEMLND